MAEEREQERREMMEHKIEAARDNLNAARDMWRELVLVAADSAFEAINLAVRGTDISHVGKIWRENADGADIALDIEETFNEIEAALDATLDNQD